MDKENEDDEKPIGILGKSLIALAVFLFFAFFAALKHFWINRITSSFE